MNTTEQALKACEQFLQDMHMQEVDRTIAQSIELLPKVREALTAAQGEHTVIHLTETPLVVDFESTAAKYRTDIIKALHDAGAPICHDDGQLMTAVDGIKWLASKCSQAGSAEQVSEREAFERWAKPDFLQHIKLDDGTYRDSFMQAAWGAWQARAALSAPERKVMTDEQIHALWQQSYQVALKEAGFFVGNADVAHMNQPVVFARALLNQKGEQTAPVSLVCKSCGADRLKEDCKGNRQECDIRGTAQKDGGME